MHAQPSTYLENDSESSHSMGVPRASATVGSSPLTNAPTMRHRNTVATSVLLGGSAADSMYATPELHHTTAMDTTP